MIINTSRDGADSRVESSRTRVSTMDARRLWFLMTRRRRRRRRPRRDCVRAIAMVLRRTRLRRSRIVCVHAPSRHTPKTPWMEEVVSFSLDDDARRRRLEANARRRPDGTAMNAYIARARVMRGQIVPLLIASLVLTRVRRRRRPRVSRFDDDERLASPSVPAFAGIVRDDERCTLGLSLRRRRV